MKLKSILTLSALAFVGAAHAGVLASWTFETSAPTTGGPIAAEVGTGTAVGSHATASTYSSPVGNGSAKSWSSNGWSVGDYYQFSTSTLGMKDVTVSFDQTASNTGPGKFKLAYSVNGGSYTDFASYTVLANATPNPTWSGTTAHPEFTLAFDLSSVTALVNQTSVSFRLVDTATTSANGGTVAAAGTNRVDNFTVSATAQPVPEPTTMAVLGLGAVAMMRRRRSAK